MGGLDTLDEGRGLETAPENPGTNGGGTGVGGDDSGCANVVNDVQQQVATVLDSTNSQWMDSSYQNTDTTDNQALGFQDYDDSETSDSEDNSDASSDDNDDDGF